ncbi:MAG: cytochrome c [Deltaproteobacteria bacterium]|nr:cytochrome c [Deltaproteobacteria bacterium]
MNRPTARAGAFLAVAGVLLGGCRKEAPRKAETPRTAQTPHAAQTLREQLQAGEALFKQYCAPCHPDGGNVTDPRRTLRGSRLKANHITRPEDIVRIMRNPISRMIRFDETTIPDRDATAIAVYIFETFK